MSGHTRDAALDEYIRQQGGVIDEAHGDRVVTFPEQPSANAREVEAAVERAGEYGTQAIRLVRPRGEGWYAAPSRETNPGFWWVLQIDEATGQPVHCECGATVACHHLGAAIAAHREEVGYEANGAAALAGWQATLDMARANAPKESQEEDW